MTDLTDLQHKRRAFLEAYAELGTVTHAAKKAGVSRQTVYNWQQADEDFAVAMHDCREAVTEDLEREAQRRALSGSDTLLIFLLKANRPDKYRENVKVEHSGSVRRSYDGVDTEQLRERARALLNGE